MIGLKIFGTGEDQRKMSEELEKIATKKSFNEIKGGLQGLIDSSKQRGSSGKGSSAVGLARFLEAIENKEDLGAAIKGIFNNLSFTSALNTRVGKINSKKHLLAIAETIKTRNQSIIDSQNDFTTAIKSFDYKSDNNESFVEQFVNTPKIKELSLEFR